MEVASSELKRAKWIKDLASASSINLVCPNLSFRIPKLACNSLVPLQNLSPSQQPILLAISSNTLLIFEHLPLTDCPLPKFLSTDNTVANSKHFHQRLVD